MTGQEIAMCACRHLVLTVSFILLGGGAGAGQPTDIRYVQRDAAPASLTSLDLYLPEPGDRPAPVMIMVHGGGWEGGDKADAGVTKNQVPWFTDRGWIYVSINYRLAPGVGYREMARDVSAAVGWVQRAIRDYGGDPDRINMMGHEAGAHLAALVTLDPTYFSEAGVNGDKPIKSVSLYNGLGFDIPSMMDSSVDTDVRRRIIQAIGETPDSWKLASPAAHITSYTGSKFPFLIQFVPEDTGAQAQASILKRGLRDAGWVARSWAADETDDTVVADVGVFNEPVMQVQLDFLGAVEGAWVYTSEIEWGEPDENGNVIQATEVDHLTAFQGKLYAGLGNWNDRALLSMPLPVTDEINSLPPGAHNGYYGAIILVKESAGAPWKVDHYFGTATMRVDEMTVLELTTDESGEPLPEPFRILYAGVTDIYRAFVYTHWKDSVTGEWGKFLLDEDSAVPAGCAGAGQYTSAPYMRKYWSAVNSVSGVHEAFAGTAPGKIYRGVYDPTAPGYIRWDSEPEFDIDDSDSRCGRPITSLNINEQNLIGMAGKIFRRDDQTGTWSEVLDTGMDPRGFTAVPAADGRGEEFLVAIIQDGGILRVDNRTDPPTFVEEVKLSELMEATYGPLTRRHPGLFSAYNYFEPHRDLATGRLQHLTGTWPEGLPHPYELTRAPWNGTFLLTRDLETREYELSLIYDYEAAPRACDSGCNLRGARYFMKSPFPEHDGRVFYTGGFDATITSKADRKLYRNTAWLYRAEWSKDIGY
jgi:arylformamidase